MNISRNQEAVNAGLAIAVFFACSYLLAALIVFGTSKSQAENSKSLSEKIIKDCYPVLKGKLGGVG